MCGCTVLSNFNWFKEVYISGIYIVEGTLRWRLLSI